MPINKNVRDFSALIGHCLSHGWVYATDPPDEAHLQTAVALGRASRLLARYNPTLGRRQYLNLLRGKEEWAIVTYQDRWHRVGLWVAWLETDPEPFLPTLGFERIRKIYHPHDAVPNPLDFRRDLVSKSTVGQ